MGYPYLYFCLCAFLLDTSASDPNLAQVPTEVVNGILINITKTAAGLPELSFSIARLDEHQASATSAPVA